MEFVLRFFLETCGSLCKFRILDLVNRQGVNIIFNFESNVMV